MKEKEKIKVNLKTVVLLAIILIVFGGIAFGVVTITVYKNLAGSSVEPQNTKSITVPEDVVKENIIEQNTVEAPEQIEEVSIDSDIVKSAYEKVYKAREAIYKYGDIQSGNVPNELKLRMAWANIEDEEGLAVELGEDYFNETEQSIAYKVEDFAKSLKNILGQDATFTNQNFTANEDRFSTGGGLPEFVYNSEKDRYETNMEFGGADRGYVEQFVTSATVQGDYLNIYVKPVFAGINEEESDIDLEYDLYVDYNYETDTFSNKLPVKMDEGMYNYEYTTTPNINVNQSKLNTYKYTFVKVGDDYYFDSLTKVVE